MGFLGSRVRKLGGFLDALDRPDGVDVATGVATTDVAKPTGVPATIGRVPTISRFFGLTIAMYFDDHGHPHFHARHASTSAKVRIDVIEVLDSSLDLRQLRLV